MKPSIGRIVIVTDEHGEVHPGIVDAVQGNDETPKIDVHVFYANGVSLASGVKHASESGDGYKWDWPLRV